MLSSKLKHGAEDYFENVIESQIAHYFVTWI